MMVVSTDIYNLLNETEKKVWSWLDKKKIPFMPQEKFFGGVTELGGAVVDFVLTERYIVIRVMGTHWHTGIEPEARDLIGREKLTEAGYQVVDVWDTDLDTPEQVEYTLNKAIRGEELPR